jgi:hypothetical protein
MAQQVIHGGEVEIHPAGKLRRLQIYDDKAVQFQVTQEKIDKESTSADFERYDWRRMQSRCRIKISRAICQ